MPRERPAPTPLSPPSPSSPTGRPTRPPDAPIGQSLPLPHERDETSSPLGTQSGGTGGGGGGGGSAAAGVSDVIAQAKRDIDAGLVDTDMRATPGLDAARRKELVPTPTRPDDTGRSVGPRPQPEGPPADRPPAGRGRP